MLQVNASAQWNSNYITKSKTHMKQSAKSITEGLSHNKDHFELETQNSKAAVTWIYLNIFTFPA